MAGSPHRRRADCRVCGSLELETFLELGPQPLANSYPRAPADFEKEPFFPLDVCFCRRCALVQTPDIVDPTVLFRHYVYRSGVSALMLGHFREQAQSLVNELKLGAKDLVVEAASNDGTLLRCFQKLDVRTLGVEPAQNLAAEARAAGVDTLDRFFDEPTAAAIRAERGPARVVVANNVLAHVDDLVGFLRAARSLLAEDGRLVVEFPYLGELLDRLEYDTIYHEHLCYFSLSPLLVACERAGLDVVRADRVAVHGGSVRLHAAPARGGHSGEVRAQVEGERASGMLDAARFRKFAADVRAHRDLLRGLLTRLRREGRSIAAYGAPAKGNTLLNWCRIGTDLVEFTVDRNPDKVGSFTPGMHLPIRPIVALRERQPDFTLILPWNLAREIVAQEAEYERRGGAFIVPVPAPTVLEPTRTSGAPR